MENQTILGRVLLQLLKIVVTSRLDQHVLLNIYFTLGSNTTNLAQVYPKEHMLQYNMWS